MQNPYAASHEGGGCPSPGPHGWGLCTGRALGSSNGGKSSKKQLRPSVPPSLPLLWNWSPAGATLLLLPPIYRDGRRRQVTAAVPSRPQCPCHHSFAAEPSPSQGLDVLFSQGMRWGVPKGHPAGTPRGPWHSPVQLPGHQLAKPSLEQCVALPTVAQQPPHGPCRNCSPQQPPHGPRGTCSSQQPLHRPHRTCSPHGGVGHGAAGGGDMAMAAGATMPVGTPWALKSAAK